jgi:hypothetical protein
MKGEHMMIFRNLERNSGHLVARTFLEGEILTDIVA